MNQLPETDVPYARHGRLWDDTLTGLQRLRRVDFLLGLGLDPSRVPDGARIEHDPTTDEYRLQVINPGGHLVWVRRRWSPPPRPRQLPPISEDLMVLRDQYASPYADRHRGIYHSADVTIIDDPIRPGFSYSPALAAAALERIGYMRARGA